MERGGGLTRNKLYNKITRKNHLAISRDSEWTGSDFRKTADFRSLGRRAAKQELN